MRTLTSSLAVAALIALTVAHRTHADIFQPDTFEDGNDGGCDVNGCTLREAMIETSGTPGDDEILLQMGTYVLSVGTPNGGPLGGDLDMNFNAVTITGVGRGLTVIDANHIDRAFKVASLGGGGLLYLRHLTIRNGLTTGLTTGGAIQVYPTGSLILEDVEIVDCVAPDDGGALAVYGSATLVDCVLTNNDTSAPWGNGGAMYCAGSNGNEAIIYAERCVFKGSNTMNGGTGCFVDFLGNASFVNCTFSGGGPTDTFLVSFGSLSLESCTVTANAQGVFVNSGTFTIRNSILANNGSTTNYFGTLTSGGHNIIGPGTGSIVGDLAGNVLTNNPMLGPLADNGGNTWTHAPLPGSPAIDAGTPRDHPDKDQRGAPRPVDGNGDLFVAPDIGAVELGSDPLLDCNGNGIDDEIDIASGTSIDCNANGIPDECDIAAGAMDCDGNGMLDSCDILAGTLHDLDGSGVADECESMGDLDGSGTVDAADLATVLGNWGPCRGSCAADVNGDGIVDAADLATVLGNWS